MIFLIDSDLRYPYLKRNYLNRIVGYDEEARSFDIDHYYNSKKKVNDEKLENYGLFSKEDDLKQSTLNIEENYFRELSKLEKIKKSNNYDHYESYLEIDYHYFEEKFWSELNQKHHCKVSCNLVWTQIYSVIKGSGDSYLLESEYENMERNLSPSQKKTIYQIYIQYERFKRRIGAFDLLDIVHHIFRQMGYVFIILV